MMVSGGGMRAPLSFSHVLVLHVRNTIWRVASRKNVPPTDVMSGKSVAAPKCSKLKDLVERFPLSLRWTYDETGPFAERASAERK